MLKTKIHINHILVLIILAVSRFPIIGSTEVAFIIIGSFILLNELRFGFKTILNSYALRAWFIGLGMLFLIQFLNLGYISIPACINYFLKILIAFYIANKIGKDFKIYFFETMVFLSSLSLLFYTFNLLGFNSGIEIGRHFSLILYDSFIEPGDIIRNNGPFWEPGAFAGYIILLLLLFLDNKDYLLKNKVSLVIIIVALLTTYSTTGYVAFFWLILAFNFKKLKSISVIYFLPILFLSFYYLKNSEFVGAKIEEQFVESIEEGNNRILFSRFGSIVMDYNYIKKNPLTGNGLTAETRFSDHIKYFDIEELSGFGNGLSNFIASFGLLFVLFVLGSITRNIFRTSKNRFFGFIGLILILFGEQFINYPLFWALLFLNENCNTDNSPQSMDSHIQLSRKII